MEAIFFEKDLFLSTLWKIDGWNLKITQLKKEIIFQSSTLGWCKSNHRNRRPSVEWGQHTHEVWQLAKLTSYLSTQSRKGLRLPMSSLFRGVSELKLWGREYPDRPGGSCSPNRFCSLDQTTLDCCRRGPTSVGIQHWRISLPATATFYLGTLVVGLMP